MTTLAAPVVERDAEHIYRVDGRVVPNVTTVLKAVGVTVDFDALPARVHDAVTRRRDLGDAVHHALHYDDQNDLDETTLDSQVAPFVQANRTFKALQKVDIVALETPVYHAAYDYAGTLDRIYLLRARADEAPRFILADFKLGDPWACCAALQTAAYQQAWEALHPDQRISERWAVRLLPDRRPPYAITRYTDFRDWSNFMACLATYRQQAERRPRR